MTSEELDKYCKASNFAKLKHAGQTDDNGKDYYKAHLFPISLAVRNLTKDIDILVAALLHDTLEDTDTTYDELVKEFGERVANLVLEVTHEGQKDEYGYYFPRLHSADAILIKLCDRASNISRMQSWDEKRKEQYLKRTKFWKDGDDK